MAATVIYLLLLLVCLVSLSVSYFTDEVAVSLVKFVGLIGSTLHGECFCEECRECICTVNKTRYVTDSSWAAIAIQEFKELDAKEKNKSPPKVWPPTDDPLDVTRPPGNVLLGKISGKLEPLLHLKRYPDMSVLSSTKFQLYDQHNFRNKPTLIHYNDIDRLKLLPIYEKMYIVIHGWIGSPHDDQFVTLRKALIEYKRNINTAVIMINWKYGARFSLKSCLTETSISCVYEMAAANALLVGRQVGFLSYLLVNGGHIKAHEIHIIGFSLGAHVAHFAALLFTELQLQMNVGESHVTIGRITALDPSARHFQDFKGAYIEKSDALFVDVIHTSAVENGGSPIDTLKGNFGMSVSVGSIDFYPNGGRNQPNCPNLKGADKTCNHQTAITYFIGSLIDGVKRTHLMSSPCESWNILSHCLNRALAEGSLYTSIMGIDANDYNGRGSHVLNSDLTPKRPKRMAGLDMRCEDVALRRKRSLGRAKKTKPPKTLARLDHSLCGLTTAEPPAGRVYMGKRAVLGQFPWTVALMEVVYTYEGYVPRTMRGIMKPPFCSGSIIDNKWILTAAHCLQNYMSGGYIIIAHGSIDVQINDPVRILHQVRFGATRLQTPNAFMHEKFKPTPGCDRPSPYDIALIRLDVGLNMTEKHDNLHTNINRVCLATVPKFDECDDYVFSGFGATTEDVRFPNYFLNTFSATRLTQHECEEGILQGKNWCGANNRHPYPGIGEGDSGGPAVVYHTIGRSSDPIRRRRAIQVGVANFGPKAEEDDRLGDVFLKNGTLVDRASSDEFVSIAQFRPWILNKLKQWRF